MRLPELRSSDLRLIAEMSAGMLACRDTIQLEEFIHLNLRRLIDGDGTVWNEISLDGTIYYGSTRPVMGQRFWGDVVPVISQEITKHPLHKFLVEDRPALHASRTSDYATFRKFLGTALYYDAYRYWDCLDMCHAAFRSQPEAYLIFQVNRSDNSFSNRDLQALQGLVGQVSNAFHLLKRRERLELHMVQGRHGRSAITRFWLTFGPQLYVKNASVNAPALLDRLFPGRHTLVNLPLLLKQKLQEAMEHGHLPIDGALSFDMNTREGLVRFDFEQLTPITFKLSGSLDGCSLSANLEASPPGSNQFLTQRELDVLGWVLEGKNNPEIGILLGIRPKTVEGHLRSIYEKLGLHSRMKLMRVMGRELHAPA